MKCVKIGLQLSQLLYVLLNSKVKFLFSPPQGLGFKGICVVAFGVDEIFAYS